MYYMCFTWADDSRNKWKSIGTNEPPNEWWFGLLQGISNLATVPKSQRTKNVLFLAEAIRILTPPANEHCQMQLMKRGVACRLLEFHTCLHGWSTQHNLRMWISLTNTLSSAIHSGNIFKHRFCRSRWCPWHLSVAAANDQTWTPPQAQHGRDSRHVRCSTMNWKNADLRANKS